MKRTRSTPLASLVARATAIALLVSCPAGADDASDLDGGKILVSSVDVPGSPEAQHVVRAVVEAPLSAVWKIINDCGRYKDHLPHIADSHELFRVGSTVTCQVTISVPFPMPNLTAVTEAVHEEHPDRMSRTWKLLRGDFDFNEGSWTLESYRGGSATMVTYKVHVKPKTIVPGFIRNMAQDKALPDLMARLRVESAKVK